MDNLTVCLTGIGKAVLLLILVNGAPVIGRKIFKRQGEWPLDFGYHLPDGYPLFGASKTWRGVFCAVLIGGLAAPVVGLTLREGIVFAVLSMLGDLMSSFIKRRLAYPESSCLRVVDTLPESLLPVVVLKTPLHLSTLDCGLVVIVFFILEATLSPILYWLHIRKRPY